MSKTRDLLEYTLLREFPEWILSWTALDLIITPLRLNFVGLNRRMVITQKTKNLKGGNDTLPPLDFILNPKA